MRSSGEENREATIGGSASSEGDNRSSETYQGNSSVPRGDAGNLPARSKWPVRFSAYVGEPIDMEVVSYHLYNAFNYSLFLPEESNSPGISIGITGPNRREGKTTVACNLATALSLGSGRKTVIVDFNLTNPAIHTVFGTPKGPGVTDALVSEEICVTKTQVDKLSVVSVGNTSIVPSVRFPAFREFLSSLYLDFDFVIVDLPAVNTRSFPSLIANQLTGLIIVVESGRTKRQDLASLFRKVNERRVLGIVLNKVRDKDF